MQAFAAYSWIEATYEADGLLRFGDRNVAVKPGMRMAGIPQHTLKVGADWRLSPAWSLGGDARWQSGRVVLGNEDGRIEDGGEPVDVSLGAYTVVNLRASWQPRTGVELLLRVDNVFDRRYETYGALAETVFDADGSYSGIGRQAVFVAPGAPRAFYATLRLRF